MDGQTAQSRNERHAESSFNLAEGALSQQIFILGRRGTGTADKPVSGDLRNGHRGQRLLPGPGEVALNYDAATQNDFDPAQTRWRTWVRDNASAAARDAGHVLDRLPAR